MSAKTPEKCPKCGAAVEIVTQVATYYGCETRVFQDGQTIQARRCVWMQRDQLAERVKRLEESGDRMAAELNRQSAPHWEDSIARLWRMAKSGGNDVDQAEAAACAVIQDERREA